jgi:hypothetical protein
MKIVAFVLLLACGAVQAQERTGIAIDPSANNVAALFTMTNEDGRLRNLDLMEGIFKDGSLGFAVQRHHNVSSPYIYSKMTELASALDENATLLLYFNSHGGGSRDRFGMTAQGGSFKFSKGLDALKKSGKTIKRLIFLVDTCHAEGSIQDSLKQDGDLLKGIQTARPTSFLPELPSSYSRKELPFVSVFMNVIPGTGQSFDAAIDYGEDSGVYEQILIISSSSVEDLSIRGAFAVRLANTFKSVRGDKEITVGEFLKRFAESHGKSGQQPHYKILPNNSMFSEKLFGPALVQTIPIKDWGRSGEKFGANYIPLPLRSITHPLKGVGL